MQAIQTKPSVAVVNEDSPRAQLQVFAPGLSDHIADIPVGEWQTVEFSLPAISGTLQIRPVDCPAVIEAREISVHSRDGKTVWAAQTLPELQALPMAGPLTILPGKGCCLFFSFGSDPIWALPSLSEPGDAVALRIVLCVHKDFKAVSEAITAAYAEVHLMTAQVRTAFADSNKILRESQRQMEAFATDRDRVLLERQEQVKLIQSANHRNAELQARNDALGSELNALRVEYQNLRQTLSFLEQSRSWRITRPLRSAAMMAQKLKKNFG